MAKAFTVFSVIIAIAFISVFIFAGIIGSEYTGTISEIKIHEVEKAFDVEWTTIEDFYGKEIPVIKLEDGTYINAEEFIANFKNHGTVITAYEVENGKAVNQTTLIITFSDTGDKLAKLKSKIPSINTNA